MKRKGKKKKTYAQTMVNRHLALSAVNWGIILAGPPSNIVVVEIQSL